MKSKIFNKRNILTFIVSFILFFIIKILGNKLVGGMYSASRGYKWDRIIDELPLTFQVAMIGAIILTIISNKERNK